MPVESVKSKDVSQDGSLAITRWLEDFAACVRAQDYDKARGMFADDVVGFGTRNHRMEGVDDLVLRQWKNVWGVTRGFRFEPQNTVVGVEGDLAWASATWVSEKKNSEGYWYSRPGRATFVLRRANGKWLAIHSHHSLSPRE